MANEERDVIRLEAETETSIVGPTPPAVKLKQIIHALDTGNMWYKDSSGEMVKFFAAENLTSQESGLGSALIGDSGIPGITPDGGGGPGASGTVHAMLLGFKTYVNAITSNTGIPSLFPLWDAATPYSQNDIVYFDGETGYILSVSNEPGEATNEGNQPNEEPYWTMYTSLPQLLTWILNNKANA